MSWGEYPKKELLRKKRQCLKFKSCTECMRGPKPCCERIVYSNGAEKTGACGEQQKMDWGGKKCLCGGLTQYMESMYHNQGKTKCTPEADCSCAYGCVNA